MGTEMGNADPSSRYRLNTSSQHRQTYGQFFTPPKVARLMLHWVLQRQPHQILDPAFGLGVFYRELLSLELRSLVTSAYEFIAYDIDPVILSYTQDIIFKNSCLTLIPKDYLKADIQGVDAIICNPPYMRFQKFLNRQEVRQNLEAKLGYRLKGNSNLASIFLMKSLSELNPWGRLAFILPFECFNTRYSLPFKEQLFKEKLLKQIIVVRNEKDIFPDALTTVCVLLCENNQKQEPVKLSFVENQATLESLQDFSQWFQAQLPPTMFSTEEKWSTVVESARGGFTPPKDFCLLSNYGHFRRGIATGANAFFSLTPSRVKQLGLGDDTWCSCISKSQQLQELVLTGQHLEQLVQGDKAIYCLDILNADTPELQAYIAFGEDCGYHQRYLTKMRHPWYKLERRPVSPLWVGVFHRQRFKVVRNLSDALHLTCFHGFYPNQIGAEWIDAIFVYLLSDVGQSLVKRNQRHYGNGLNKFEPGDLNQSLAPNLEHLQGMDQRLVVKVLHLAQEDVAGAIALSNQLMEPLYPGP